MFWLGALTVSSWGDLFGLMGQSSASPTGIASGLTGVCHSIFSACEIERRPRGASRAGARSYVCFGPIIPMGFARERLGAWLDIASYEQGGRAR
ncbi:hypothetical protein, partial [Pseudomonas putida]|uniref:hypothetical protein n=1 Tax=Pseudomonas putida TaxID=303 RepID=UPI00300F602F